MYCGCFTATGSTDSGRPCSRDTCGKSILADLLKSHVELVAPNNVKVYLFNWNPLHLKKNQLDQGSQFYQILDCLTQQPNPLGRNWLNQQNTLLMIDEAQLSYAYINLWNDFIKWQSGAGYLGMDLS